MSKEKRLPMSRSIATESELIGLVRRAALSCVITIIFISSPSCEPSIAIALRF